MSNQKKPNKKKKNQRKYRRLIKRNKDLPLDAKSSSNNNSKSKPIDKQESTKNPKIKEKPKSLEEIYGSKRISEQLLYSKEFSIPNPNPIIPFGIVSNQSKNSQKKYIPNKFSNGNPRIIFSNIDDIKIEDMLLEMVKTAKKTICISSFLLEAKMKLIDELFRLSKKGIRIYLLLASEKDAKKSIENEGKKAVNDHLEFLENAGSGKMIIRAGGFHAKYILIDPNTSNSNGCFLTANISWRPLTKNNEIAVKLNPLQTNELFRQFKYGFWVESTHQYFYDATNKKSRLEPLSQNSGILEASTQDIVWTTSDSKSIRAQLKKYLEEHDLESFWISSWNFSMDNELSELILKKANSKTKVLLTSREKNYNAITEFLNKDSDIRFNELQHAKFFVTDDFAIIFSANFEAQGLDYGYESGIILRNEEYIKEIREIFSIWFENSEEIAFRETNMKKIVNQNVRILQKESNKVEIQEEFIKPESLNSETIKLTWNLEDFLQTQDDSTVFEKITGDGLIDIDPYSLLTKVGVSIKPKNLQMKVNYVKKVGSFHLWARNKNKSEKRFLIINFDPISNPSEIAKAQEIARQENAELILY